MSKRVDSNHTEIVRGLRAVGATVRSTATVGQGFPDIAVGWRGLTWLLEIKDGSKSPSKRVLTEAEQAFHNSWRGAAAVVTSLEDALKIIGAEISLEVNDSPNVGKGEKLDGGTGDDNRNVPNGRAAYTRPA